ncbi:hypothetical protein TanjilG_02101 [Lupinus angustifolius]|nr:hypothetical protein TanjilG_02101 [Lupinus angustifolius]
MASTEGLVPITRSFLASYYDRCPYTSLSQDISRLSSQIRSINLDFINQHPPTTQDETLLINEALHSQPPHKIDENMWKNREFIEESIFLLDTSNWPHQLQDDVELSTLLGDLKHKLHNTLNVLESFQIQNSEHVFNTVMTYLPQDFRGTLLRQQRERSERNKQAEVEALVNSGGSIRDRYALLWKQQMDRRRQLAQLGSATGVYKTLVKYLVGVPQVLLDFVRQINDDDGPMEEQRHRYGPPLYSLTSMILSIRLFLSLSWARYEARKFKNDIYKEISVPAGKIYEDIGFSLEFISPAGEKTALPSTFLPSLYSFVFYTFDMFVATSHFHGGWLVMTQLMLPYRRYESDQGNFCTLMAGSYKLIWDNTYSTFFKKVLRYKVDCIPPVAEPVQSD